MSVCVLDDGIEHTHDDLKDNYVGILVNMSMWECICLCTCRSMVLYICLCENYFV